MKFFALILSSMLFSGCSLANPEFTGKEYKMVDAPKGAEITIGFDAKENNFFGKSAVNRYMGTYSADKVNIKFSRGGSTMMMGPMELMDVESEYLEFLDTVKTYKIDNGVLSLSNGTTTFNYEEIKE